MRTKCTRAHTLIQKIIRQIFARNWLSTNLTSTRFLVIVFISNSTYFNAISSYKDHCNFFNTSSPYFRANWSLSGPYFSCSFLLVLVTIGKKWKTFKIPSIYGYEKSSLVVSKSIILCVRYSDSKFLMSIKTISIFWSLIFPNPVLMVLKLWNVQYLVLIKLALIRW